MITVTDSLISLVTDWFSKLSQTRTRIPEVVKSTIKPRKYGVNMVILDNYM